MRSLTIFDDEPPSYEIIGNIDQIKFNEPSGIVYHPERGTLFAVGDEGDICEIQTDGTLVKQKLIRHADFEGITVDPSTGLLYIAIEGEEKIIEVNPENFNVLREFSINRYFEGKLVLKAGGQGIEAITFVPDQNHPEGGTFYVANQGFDLNSTDDPSAIFEIEIPLKTNPLAKTGNITKYFCIGAIDLSGLYYDNSGKYLIIISDSANLIYKVTLEGDVVKSYQLPGDNQEGITFDNSEFMYIAQDSGGIIKMQYNIL